MLAASHGTALRWLEHHARRRRLPGRHRLKPDYAEAYYEAGTIPAVGRLAEAETMFRQWLMLYRTIKAASWPPPGERMFAPQAAHEAEPLLRQPSQQPFRNRCAASA
jgi:hypothetical protein